MFSAADVMYLRHFSNPTDSRVLTVAVDPSRSIDVGNRESQNHEPGRGTAADLGHWRRIGELRPGADIAQHQAVQPAFEILGNRVWGIDRRRCGVVVLAARGLISARPA